MFRRIFLAMAYSLPALILAAAAGESLSLPSELPPLDKRGLWRETLEDLTAIGIPENWTLLGPISNETAKAFDRQLEPEKTDDWSKPLTDNMGRLMKPTLWSKPKEDEGCYVDLADIFPNAPVSPVACALTEIDSPVDGPALLWFEHAGFAVVYFNNREILSASAKRGRTTEGAPGALFPLPVELKRGKNYLKIKIYKERRQTLKGWGFYARLERDDLEWRKQLLAKLKELYPEKDAGPEGAEERMILARRYEKAGQADHATPLYKEVLANFAAQDEACEDARNALKRLAAPAKADDASAATRDWAETERLVKAALAAGQTLAADRLLRDFIARFPFSDETGLALCVRGGLRLDYACDESARPFYERALHEYSRSEPVRTQSVRALEFARFLMPDHPQLEINRPAEAGLAALQRQLRNGNDHDNAAGLKALGELLVAESGALVRAGGTELYPRCASVNLIAREYLATLGAEERKLFREPLARPSEMMYRHALAGGNPLDLEEVARKFPGAAASAKALNQAGNLCLDRGQYARAAQAFGMLLRDFHGSELIVEPLAAAKEIRALEGLNQFQAAREALQKMGADFAGAKFVLAGRETSIADFVKSTEQRLPRVSANAQAAAGADYETFCANPRRLGAVAAPAPMPGRLEWTRPIQLSAFLRRAIDAWPEDKTHNRFEPFPVVSAGRVFFATRQDVRAFELGGGKELWSKHWDNADYVQFDRSSNFRFEGYPLTLPVVKDDKVFVRVVTGEKNSVIRCYDAATGKLDWSTDGMASLREFIWSSEPLAAYNLIVASYFEALDHETVRCGIAALDPRNGALVWKRVFGVGMTGIRVAEKNHESRDARYSQVNYRVTLQLGPPSAYEGTIYAATGLGSLAALNAYTGEAFWIAEYPRLRAGNLYSGNSGMDGFLPRMMKVLSRGPSSPVVGENVVALAPRDAPGIVAFDRQTGELRWTRELLDARFIAGVCGGKLLVADDTVSALDLESGNVAWECTPSQKRLAGQPGYSGGILYLPYDDGLFLVDARDGAVKKRWDWDPKTNGALANLVVAGDRILGVNNGFLASISAK